MALKELEVKYATKRQRPYKLSDGEGLHLLVQPNGSKLWRLKYRFDGKEKLLSFDDANHLKDLGRVDFDDGALPDDREDVALHIRVA